MIQANELRIGNIVRKNDIRFHVSEIHANGLVKCIVSNGEHTAIVDISNPDGEMLTPELLEKCGFKEDSPTNKDCMVHLNPDMILWHNSKILSSHPEGDYWHTCYWKGAIVIQYLHQLQNLYFALTGEELEINL